MIGPMDFRMNDESGILVDGYDVAPIIRMNWHPPYYQALCENGGLDKVVDLYMWNLMIDRPRPDAADAARDRGEGRVTEHGIKLRKMSRRAPAPELDLFAEIYNWAWRKNFGFVPYTKHDLDAYAQELQLAYDKDFFMVVEDERRAGGAGADVPRPQPGAQGDERQAAAARLVEVPAPQEVHRPRSGRLPRRQARVPAHRDRGPDVRAPLRHGGQARLHARRDGLDPRDEQGHEPRRWRRCTGASSSAYRVYERLLEEDAKPAAPRGAAPA